MTVFGLIGPSSQHSDKDADSQASSHNDALAAKKLRVLYPPQHAAAREGRSKSGAKMKRLFAAVELPTGVQQSIGESMQRLRCSPAVNRHGEQVARLLRWVPPHLLHITLHFIGNVAEDRIPSLAAALGRYVAASGTRPFQVTIGSLGAFKSSGVPRVLWQGVDAECHAPFQCLAVACRAACVEQGVTDASEPARFNAHITMARVGNVPDNRRRQRGRERKRGSQTPQEMMQEAAAVAEGGDGGDTKQQLKNLSRDFSATTAAGIGLQEADPSAGAATADTDAAHAVESVLVAKVSLMWSHIVEGKGPTYTCLHSVPLLLASSP